MRNPSSFYDTILPKKKKKEKNQNATKFITLFLNPILTSERILNYDILQIYNQVIQANFDTVLL